MNRNKNYADKGMVKTEACQSPKQVRFQGGNGKISPEQVRRGYENLPPSKSFRDLIVWQKAHQFFLLSTNYYLLNFIKK
jgi:hypothetical protein